MNEPLPDGGAIRKLWIGETDAYRDHLLRLDRESRYRRFSGAVSDDFIARHAATANEMGVVVHGFFVDGVLRGAAELRLNGAAVRAKAKRPSASNSPGKATASAPCCSSARCCPRAIAASSCCTCIALRKTGACSNLARKFDAELSLRFRQRGRRGRSAALDAAVADARGRTPTANGVARRRCSSAQSRLVQAGVTGLSTRSSG